MEEDIIRYTENGCTVVITGRRAFLESLKAAQPSNGLINDLVGLYIDRPKRVPLYPSDRSPT